MALKKKPICTALAVDSRVPASPAGSSKNWSTLCHVMSWELYFCPDSIVVLEQVGSRVLLIAFMRLVRVGEETSAAPDACLDLTELGYPVGTDGFVSKHDNALC